MDSVAKCSGIKQLTELSHRLSLGGKKKPQAEPSQQTAAAVALLGPETMCHQHGSSLLETFIPQQL